MEEKRKIFCFSFKLARGSCSNNPINKTKSQIKQRKRKIKMELQLTPLVLTNSVVGQVLLYIF